MQLNAKAKKSAKQIAHSITHAITKNDREGATVQESTHSPICRVQVKFKMKNKFDEMYYI